jgi:3-carboxy-cis,cis-muconate cycloisomerase
MAVSAIDSRVFRNLFGTEEIHAIFSDEAYIKRLVDVEAALARAEASAGMIPETAGDAITASLKEVTIE